MSYLKFHSVVKKKIIAKLQTKTLLNEKRSMCFSEAKGRNWRFRCFARIYLNHEYNLTITGHTATDRSETAFLQLIRGTSLYGMTRFQKSKGFKSVYPKFLNYSIFFYT